MKKIELLAPAGNMESLNAAINAGADAIYLGGYMFGARSFSSNFSNEEIIEAINYAHIMGVKIYVTTNTVIYENEIETFLEYIDFLHENNVDAVIIQDIGMLDLIRKTYPNLEIHASTQMHIHNLEGALLLEEIGVKRTVLARETTTDEISYIKDNSNIDLEIFVHGALCVSYSGQCLMSSMIGNRSGNRGTCAQTCRKKYKLYTDKKLAEGYLISPKDLYTVPEIGVLIEKGISSLKIEGRMKRPEYVYQIVKMYRDAIDSYYEKNTITNNNKEYKDALKLFNREFTKGFLFNEKNDDFTNEFRPNHMGIKIGTVVKYNKNRVTIKLTDDISINDGIRIIGTTDIGLNINNFYINQKLCKTAKEGDIIEFELKHSVAVGSDVLKTTDYLQIMEIAEKIKENKQIKITGKITIKENDFITLTVNDSGNEIEVISKEKVEKSLNRPIALSEVEKQIKKTGGSNYIFSDLAIEIQDNLFVNLKTLNELRREAFSKLDEVRKTTSNYLKNEYFIELPEFNKEKNINILLYDGFDYETFIKLNVKDIYTDNFQVNGSIKRLPRVIINHESEYQKLLVSEMGSIRKYNNFETDCSFNVTNSHSVAFLHSVGSKKVTLSHELTVKQVSDIIKSYEKKFNKHPNVEVIVYGYPEVMINKFNLLNKYKMSDYGYLIDEFENKYYIDQINERMRIFNYEKKPYIDIDVYFNIGVNNVRFDIAKFDSSKEEVIKHVKQYK